MSASRRSWSRVLLISFVAAAVLGTLFGVTAADRVSTAYGAEDDLDGIYSLAAVSTVEGAVHTEANLALAVAAGLAPAEELAVAIEETNVAREALQEEITFYEADEPIGAALIAIDASLDGLATHRSELTEGTLEGSIVAPYLPVLELTAAAIEPIDAVLVAPAPGPATVLTLAEARRAASDAVLGAAAVVVEGADPAAAAAALTRAEQATASLTQADAPLAPTVTDALAADDVATSRAGVEALATGDLPADLFAWGDVADAWPVALGEIEAGVVESGLATLETRATDAESTAKRYLITGGIASAVAVALVAVAARLIPVRRRDGLNAPVGATSPGVG